MRSSIKGALSSDYLLFASELMRHGNKHGNANCQYVVALDTICKYFITFKTISTDYSCTIFVVVSS